MRSTSPIDKPSAPEAHSANRGQLFIISAPSGAGKTTLCRAVRKHFPEMLYSVSYTTRKPRRDEQDGIDYFFISRMEFSRRINLDLWAEWAEVYGNFYGTSAEVIDQALQAGKAILLDIDVQGTIQLLKRYPQAITIFIAPPSLKALRTRLTARATDDAQAIERRLRAAQKEMGQKKMYRHSVVNDDLDDTVEALKRIIAGYQSGQAAPK